MAVAKSQTPELECLEPVDPEGGDYRFKGFKRDGRSSEEVILDPPSFNPYDWPREPGEYEATTHFINRKRENKRTIQGKWINEAITEGELVPAFDDCAAFVTDLEGVAFYIVVGWDRRHFANEGDRVAVTAWPWVYNRETALDTGRFSTRQLTTMQRLNDTLMNEETADSWFFDYVNSEY